MAGEKLIEATHQFRQFIKQKGWSIADEKEIDYGYQFTVTDGLSKVPVALYATGKTLVQGKTCALQAELKAWKQSGNVATIPLVPSQTVIAPQATGLARIGSDESGKGDFFGPLVIAAVYVDQNTEPQLLKLGVKDSKKLTDKLMLGIAREIRAMCPHQILTYLPSDYNQSYQQLPNLNLLLARAHAQVIAAVATKTASTRAIVDQFGDEALVRQALLKTGCKLELEQRHRAEEDTAVAAASIMARAEFVRQLARLSEHIGFDLPKGASNPRIVEIGREIVRVRGQEGLAHVAKLHFKTTGSILPT